MNQMPFFTGPKPRILGHRGAAGESPENTLPSFRKAFDNGADMVELDVRGTSDGQVIILHDATLDRTTNGRGRVSRRTLEEIRALDAGYRFSPDGGTSYPFRGKKVTVPTLEEFFRLLPQARAVIEVKANRPPIVATVVETICRLGKQGQALLATEDDRIMAAIRREIASAKAEIATGFAHGEVAAFLKWLSGRKPAGYSPPGQAMQIPRDYRGITLVSEPTVRAAKELEIEMFVWTVNEADEMARLIDLGVDGIITDYPGRLRALVRPLKCFSPAGQKE